MEKPLDPVDYLENKYEISNTKKFIEEGCFQRVALQFPDELLKDATNVFQRLSIETKASFFILGGTSYGSCCVDEIEAQHVNADCIIHYGHACLSITTRLPVKYVFDKPSSLFNINKCLDKFKAIYNTEDYIILVGKPCYINILESIFSKLISFGYNRIIKGEGEYSAINITKAIGEAIVADDKQRLDLYKKWSIFYIGEKSPGLTTLAMTCYSHVMSFYSYNPEQDEVIHQSPISDIQLRRRYAIIQKAKDVSIIGIVVGTLGVSRYLEVTYHLREMIKKAGRKCYMFIIGKLSPEKLANFSEIQIFVLVSCSENSLIESKDFYRPIITPYELYLALSSEIWNKQWITDFSSILCLNLKEDELIRKDEPQFSLATGHLIQPSIIQDDEILIKNDSLSNSHKGIMKLNEHMELSNTRIHSVSAYFHKNTKSWHGLSKLEIQTEPSKLETGQQGIASKYDHEEH
ncbi:diphthamide biosynthesis protein 2 [Pneumocystis murina B123]|uniref:2-(3-amino-3-carboxypropyl)histidine synthase subunit 2 n=1 Tax=Pneumocystis murina (strain B123) TaxID=1069680 RepID=M7NL27_PNEMU|nr:diphthamide biosynthesis protein 2 [Pneumocystis murina B123]EMR09358.1 diphthamide biosynthesis protein 2 [Pneumocystis murina B123]